VKKPTSFEDYKAYAFGFVLIGVVLITPFAIIATINFLVQ
tara:strand:+ start:3238 stop:3357 length:120 start_codon:yes stop_codon:yes gene_type:complete